MLQTIEAVNSAVNQFIWGIPAMICIIGVGLYLSLRLRFIQIRRFPYAMKTTIGRVFRKREASDGAITPLMGNRKTGAVYGIAVYCTGSRSRVYEY